MYKYGFLLLILILVCNHSFAQNVRASQIKRLFKESKEPRKLTSSYLSHRMTWQSPNNNNEYYNADTVMLYSYEPKNTACTWVNWTFQSWNRFNVSTYYLCEGRGYGEVDTRNYKKKIKLIQNNNCVYLHICSNDTLESCFWVNRLERIFDTISSNKHYKIVLVRQK